MFFNSKMFQLVVALLAAAVVLMLPLPEGTTFKVSGDETEALSTSVQKQFERVGARDDSSSIYWLRLRSPASHAANVEFLSERAKGLGLTRVKIDYVDGVSPRLHKFFAILTVLIVLFLLKPIPLEVSSICVGLLLSGFGIADAKSAWAPYMHPVVVFIMCYLIFAVSADKSGLTRRLGFFIIRLAGTSVVRFTFILAIGLGMASSFIHDAAACAVGIVTMQPLMRAAGIQPNSSTAKFMMLSVPFATSCGGMGSLIGGGRCMVSAAFLKEFTGLEISFLDWIQYAGPAAVITVPLAVTIVYLFFRPNKSILLPQFDESVGPWTPVEIKTLLITAVTLALWLTKGFHGIDYSVTGMLGVSALILFGVLTWEDIHTNLEWGTSLFIFGGGISLGLAMVYTGAADFFAVRLSDVVFNGADWLVLFMVVSLMGALATNVMANVVAAALILPTAMSIAHLQGIDPRLVALCFGTSTSFAMLRVIGCPPNAIAYSYRYFRSSDLTRVGLVATPVLLGVLALVARFWWKLLGIF